MYLMHFYPLHKNKELKKMKTHQSFWYQETLKQDTIKVKTVIKNEYIPQVKKKKE